MTRIENDCVGCVMGCIDCGRKHAVHYFCDKCDDDVEPDELYDTEAGELCKDCLLKMYESKFYGDFENPDEMCCEQCGTQDAEDFYYYDGEWIWEGCLLGQYEKVKE